MKKTKGDITKSPAARMYVTESDRPLAEVQKYVDKLLKKPGPRKP